MRLLKRYIANLQRVEQVHEQAPGMLDRYLIESTGKGRNTSAVFAVKLQVNTKALWPSPNLWMTLA